MRILFIVLGTISLTLGIIGIFLPLLPTTPFLLLTSYLYYRSSPKYYDWLIRQPVLGKYIQDYKEKKVIPLRAKILSLTLLWGTILYCVVFVIESWWIRGLLLLIAIGVSVHILSFRNN
ncbi:MAG: YbaN family protein [Bacteroidales bacterium]|nr:YbaN family protein [Bacteroidales bacterium]